jgi:hypothetical protein
MKKSPEMRMTSLMMLDSFLPPLRTHLFAARLTEARTVRTIVTTISATHWGVFLSMTSVLNKSLGGTPQLSLVVGFIVRAASSGQVYVHSTAPVHLSFLSAYRAAAFSASSLVSWSLSSMKAVSPSASIAAAFHFFSSI